MAGVPRPYKPPLHRGTGPGLCREQPRSRERHLRALGPVPGRVAGANREGGSAAEPRGHRVIRDPLLEPVPRSSTTARRSACPFRPCAHLTFRPCLGPLDLRALRSTRISCALGLEEIPHSHSLILSFS